MLQRYINSVRQTILSVYQLDSNIQCGAMYSGPEPNLYLLRFPMQSREMVTSAEEGAQSRFEMSSTQDKPDISC